MKRNLMFMAAAVILLYSCTAVSVLASETDRDCLLYTSSKEYVRNKDGKDFVYVEGKDHRLERRNVQVGKNFYGSMLEIKNGLTEEDHIAFPYGKKVKEGVKVRRAAIEDLYSMY